MPAFLLFGGRRRRLHPLAAGDQSALMSDRPTHPPGHTAPVTATYEQTNVFGSATGVRVRVPRGHPLPRAPQGHGWVVHEEHEEEC
jgi:hypothetical protein